MTLHHIWFPKVEGWEKEAKCRGLDPDIFFPFSQTPKKGVENREVSEAKAVCRFCPVKEECLRFALKFKIMEGIWGGLTEAERRKVRRKKK